MIFSCLQEATQVDANVDVSFIPFFLTSDAEPPEDVAFSEHERELLLRYTHTTGHELREEVGCLHLTSPDNYSTPGG